MRTWPDDWEDRRRGVNCHACMEGRPDGIPSGQRVFAGRLTDAYLNRDMAARGYTLVLWRGRHIADPGRPPRFMMVDQPWPPIPDDEYARELEELRAAIRWLSGDGGTEVGAPGG